MWKIQTSIIKEEFFPLEVTLVSIMFASSSLVLIGLIFSDDFSPLMVQEPLFLTGRPPC